MKIARKPDRASLDNYKSALAMNFALTPRVPVYGGKLADSLDETFLLAGLVSQEKSSTLILGVARVGSTYQLQGASITDEAAEAWLLKHLVNVTGLKSVEYARHLGDEGEVIIATLTWGEAGRRIRQAIGSNHKTLAWNFVTGTPSNSAASDRHTFSEAALSKYVERRREVKPDAVELRFPQAELPRLLGFRDDSRDAAAAAFGYNEGVASAVFYRPRDRAGYPAPGDTSFIRGGSRERLPPAQTVMSPMGSNPSGQGPGQKKRFYKLGGDVFTVIDNLREHICTTSNLLGGRDLELPKFDTGVFAEILRELCLNAFAHGRWGTHLFGRDDDEQMVGPRLAIVDLENRIEVVNELREAGNIYQFNVSESTRRRSSVHNAFVDMGFAHGRTMGLKLVRHHAARMGLPAPMFVRDVWTYRAIIPWSLPMPGWSVRPNWAAGQKRDPIALYALHLGRFLGRLDEYILSSALYVRPQEARSALSELANLGGLAREDRNGVLWHNGFSDRLVPSFTVADRSTTDRLIAKLSDGLQFYLAPASISLGAQYQLSVRSTPYLNEKDGQEYLRGIYEFELPTSSSAEEAAARHMDVLRSIPEFFRPMSNS